MATHLARKLQPKLLHLTRSWPKSLKTSGNFGSSPVGAFGKMSDREVAALTGEGKGAS